MALSLQALYITGDSPSQDPNLILEVVNYTSPGKKNHPNNSLFLLTMYKTKINGRVFTDNRCLVNLGLTRLYKSDE
jgi:hypothetical protein